MTSAIPLQVSVPVPVSVPVLQRSWVRFPFKPEFFQVSSFQLLKLKHLHCHDLHIILDYIQSRFSFKIFKQKTEQMYV